MSRLFPELAVPEVPTSPPPARGPSRAQHPVLAAPAGIVERMRRALALPVEVRAVYLREADIRIDTAHGDGLRAIFLTPPEVRAWRRGPGFGIAVQGDSLEPALALALRTFLDRHGKTRLDALRDWIRKAIHEAAEGATGGPRETSAGERAGTAETGQGARAGHGGTTSPERWDDFDGTRAARLDEPDAQRLRADRSAALFFSYGARAAWRTFFEDNDLYRGGCSHLGGRVATVMHREVECAYNHAPPTAWGRGSFGALTGEPDDSQDAGHAMLLDTDLNDRDVILGGDARLDQAFDALAAMPVRPDLVLVQSTCVPVVTGDDLEASAERARRKHRLPIAVLGYLEHPNAAAVLLLLEQLRPGRTDGSAVLLGLSRVAGLRDLQELLGDAGVTLRGPLIPDHPQDAQEALERASVLVTYDEPHTREDVARVIERLGDRTVLAPPPPFDPEASRAFCRAVAASAGAEAAFDACWDALRPQWEPRWRAWTARASRYSVAFVSDVADWRSRIRSRLGVPLLATVRAMGFSVEVLAYTHGAERPAPSDDPAITVRSFAAQAELESLLRASPASLVYSEVRYDRRVARCGHASFSLEDLAAGPVGATRALEVLVARCETPWFRRHGARAGAAFNEERRG